MLNLHDKYNVQNAIKTMYLQDFKAMKKGLLHDTLSLESFLSCNAPSVVSNSNILRFQPQEKLNDLLECKDAISAGYPKNYRANDNLDLSHFPSLKTLDGVSGPSFNNNAKQYLIGIDPGLTGAIAIIKLPNPHESIKTSLIPSFVGVYDMPTYTLKVSNKNRKRIDLGALSSLLDLYAGQTKLAIIEDVGQVGTNADPFSSFVFGFATGAVHGSLAMAGVKIEKIKPNIWKAALGLDAEKDPSIKLAIKLFPESQKYLTRKLDHGRAEALLMAWFAYKNLRKQ